MEATSDNNSEKKTVSFFEAFSLICLIPVLIPVLGCFLCYIVLGQSHGMPLLGLFIGLFLGVPISTVVSFIFSIVNYFRLRNRSSLAVGCFVAYLVTLINAAIFWFSVFGRIL